MALQVTSSSKSVEQRSAAVVLAIIWVCILLCPLSEGSTTQAHAQTKPSTSGHFHFKVTDSETDLPIQGASVSLVYWRTKESAEEKKEIELKTDKNGIAEVSKVTAENCAITVVAKGYKSHWHWIRSNRSEELIHVRLEKWASTPQ